LKPKEKSFENVLLKYSNSFELTFTNCDALRAFFKPGFG